MRTRALAYFVSITLFLAFDDLVFAVARFPGIKPSLDGYATLVDRTAWYENHRADYNVIFLGDSRTYCGIHPDFIDPLTGSSSLNLSTLAHWFPNQLPQIERLAPLIPKDTTVVWSIGVVNFGTPGPIQLTYPVGFTNAARYLWWGAQSKGLLDNLFHFNPALYVLSERENIKHRLDLFMRKPLSLFSAAHAWTAKPDDPHAAEANQMFDQYSRDPAVAAVDPETAAAQGRLSAMIVRFKRGSYYRIELDRDYFIENKNRMKDRWGEIPINVASLKMFEEALHIFKAHNVRLVVSEIEEAPFMYIDKQWHRRFMRDVVEKRVRELGFSYVRVDFDKLTDDDYFDYNHLNSRGVARFSPMLADQLRPIVSTYPR